MNIDLMKKTAAYKKSHTENQNLPSMSHDHVEKNEFELKRSGIIKRLTYKTFQFDPRIQSGFFSAAYFIKTQHILTTQKDDNTVVLMQFFQRQNAILCGIDEVIALLHQYAKNPHLLIIKALHDGDIISAFEPVLTVEGPYEYFGFLEGIIDGILARRSSVASNAHALVKILAHHKSNAEIIFMGDRDDDYHNQMGDGYASKIGGIHKHATDAMGLWFGGKGVGTMPHALIQGFSGDLVAASKAYLKCFSDPLIALVDYNNDVIGDALMLANALGEQLYGVRIDTSPMMVDKYFMQHPEVLGQFDPRGINPQLICILRKALDDANFKHVKIIASGGFNAAKLQHFLEMSAPVDIYGVGASLLKVNIGFTGDCVCLNQKPCAKAGRRFQKNLRLEDVIYPKNVTH